MTRERTVGAVPGYATDARRYSGSAAVGAGAMMRSMPAKDSRIGERAIVLRTAIPILDFGTIRRMFGPICCLRSTKGRWDCS